MLVARAAIGIARGACMCVYVCVFGLVVDVCVLLVVLKKGRRRRRAVGEGKGESTFKGIGLK